MRKRRVLLALLVFTLVAVLRSEPDKLADEIARLSAVLAADSLSDPLWADAKKAGEAALTQAGDELRKGRRLVALERLAAAQQTIGAAQYALGRPAERKELPAFESEWKRIGVVLADAVSAPTGQAMQSATAVRPALARALAEIAVSQVRELYSASLAYGRNTEPQYGLYYLGAAQAQRRFIDFARGLPPSSTIATPRAPQLRGLRDEIDALQSMLLTAYRPPASIDRHAEFIVASSALKEAREQDAAGHRYAALLRYLQAAQRVAMLRPPGSTDMPAVKRRLEEMSTRLNGGVDHSIGRFFVERAHSAIDGPAGASGDATVTAIATDVLPRYLAALEPARPGAPRPAPAVTVTLVRWPFT